MTAYVVRVAKTRELVGLYSARTLESLRHLVDEVCSWDDCEYANLPDGGVYFNDGAAPVPLAHWCEDAGDPDPYGPLFQLAVVTGRWMLEEDRRWRPLGGPQL